MSRFGVRGGNKAIVSLGGIIADDAHVAFSTVRDCFTLWVQKSQDPETYGFMADMFRPDFKEVGRIAGFSDIVAGKDYGIIAVPFWAWKAKLDAVRQKLAAKADKEYVLVWPFLRDSLEYCHALFSKDAFVITPLLPFVDMVPAFAECPRRLFLSATIPDDTAIVSTFDAAPASVAAPITSRSLAGVSERMILAPELTGIPHGHINGVVKSLVQTVVRERSVGAVILVPSGTVAQQWVDVATYPETSEKVAGAVSSLQKGTSRGPVVFANRYDGIDLPGDTCRILVMDGLPRAMGEYDRFKVSMLTGGKTFANALAQRVEQGIGRGARGSGDHCVVILTGQDLIAWV